jgi:glutaredoxin-related protein
MKRVATIVLVFFAMSFAGSAQNDSTFQLIKTLKGDILDFTIDNLDNIYILNSRNQVKKFDSKGDSVAVFNDVKKFGQATLIDVSNPLKVLLYYRDFATIVVLDRFLNIRNTIDLRKQNILQAKAIGQSYDNKIWLYDELENKLKKIDENKYVYIYDSLQGVYVFDYFGSLKNNIMIDHWQNFKVAGKYIFGSRADTLYRYEISTFRYDEWKMPEQISKSKAFNFSSSRLYALMKDCNGKESCIFIYSIR